MALVDYTSDSDAESDAAVDRGPPAKKPRIDDGKALPPLPSAFHDLYASTVRTSTADDPSLHQGRVRQIPHKAGNWPSHVYIEWHPPNEAFSLLTRLISTLQKKTTDVTITSFLTSDLGVPLPIHISLSRPLSLNTANKEGFLTQLVSSIKRSNIPPFDLCIRDVEWHRTEESGRSFLVLRLESSSHATSTSTATNHKNPELTELLKRCNKIAKEHGQPGLYEWASDISSDDERDSKKMTQKTSVSNAFHISIAWSFSPPSDGLKQLTTRVFGPSFTSTSTAATATNINKGEETAKAEPQGQPTDKVRTTTPTCVHVDAVKAKIGNVVTNIPLPTPDRKGKVSDTNRLLGLTP
ncbi:U6 snRNA phosphodiesterase Usb1 [Rhypophila decipiens]